MTDPRLETAIRFRSAFEEELRAEGSEPASTEGTPSRRGTGTGSGDGEAGFAAKLLAQRWILGPLSVERARRAPLAAPAALADRLADRAVAARASSKSKDGADTTEPNARSTSLGPCVAAALRAHAAGVALKVAPAAPLERLLEVCAPLLADGLKTTEIEDSRRTATVVIAPYFYAPFDLERLADHLALERLHASPLADGGLRLIVAAQWEQRRGLLELVAARVGERAATSMVTTVSEADEIPDLLGAVVPEGFVSAFVYPMWLERDDVRAATTTLAAGANGFILNARPSIAFWLGGETGERFEAPQLLRPAPSLDWCRRRSRYERRPTLSTALRSAVEGWVPSLVFR
jgi:hypothetical protein